MPDMPITPVERDMERIDADMMPQRPDMPDLDVPDDGPQPDMCVPRVKEAVCTNVCGMQEDGCGGMLDCGEPLSETEACAGTCGEQSDGCGATIVCAPCACVSGEPAQARCGVCQLGASRCDASDVFSCEAYEIPRLTAQSDCEAQVVYVHKEFVGESTGSVEAPFRTIAEATQAAKDRGAVAILVGGSEAVIYEEVLEVLDGVSVLGGWSPEWAPDPTRRPKLVAPLGAEPADVFGAKAIDVDDWDTKVANLQILTPDVLPSTEGPGHTNYGFYARNASRLTLENMLIRAGKGGDGADGADGMDGEGGFTFNGSNGFVGIYSTDAIKFRFDGGQFDLDGVDSFVPMDYFSYHYIMRYIVGVSKCGFWRGSTARSGAGGHGGYQAKDENMYLLGENGFASEGGIRGGEATATASSGGRNGSNGRAPSPVRALDGQGGKSLGEIYENGLLMQRAEAKGEVGKTGINGQGGGGGAGGPQTSTLRLLVKSCYPLGPNGSYFTETCSADVSVGAFGPSGGEGGHGGCGGYGGAAGEAGGHSVGLFLAESVTLKLSNSTRIISGRGGDGGRGGSGGEKGIGGTGGAGTDRFCKGALSTECQAVPLARSGDGGKGSDGQAGGHGGGGAGGGSFGGYCVSATLTADGGSEFMSSTPGTGRARLGVMGAEGRADDLFDCQ